MLVFNAQMRPDLILGDLGHQTCGRAADVGDQGFVTYSITLCPSTTPL